VSDRLRREIESLLRGHWRGPLPAGLPRAAVLGSRNTVVPQVGAAVLLSPPLPVAASGLRIEPGLMCLSGTRADIVYPFRLEMPSWLSAWAGGGGINVPESVPPRTTLLLGELASAPDLVPPFDWPDGSDWSGRLYASAAALDAALRPDIPAAWIATPAGPYTGWARLAAEACLASGRALGAWLPALCTSAPGALGMAWSTPDPETGLLTGWVLDVDGSGVWGWRMVHDPLTEPLLRALAAGSLIGDAAHLAWLYVVSGLTPAGGRNASPAVILDDVEMAPAYADGGHLHMAGWVWPDYDAGVHACATVAGGVFDVGLTSQGYESRLYRIDFTAVGVAVPTAILSAGSLARWRPWWAYHKMWCGEASDLYLLRHGQISTGSDGCDAEADVCCVWEGATLRRWKYFRGESVPTATWESDTLSGSWAIMRGGYGWTTPPDRLVGSGTRTNKGVTVGGDGELQQIARQKLQADDTCCTGDCRERYSSSGYADSQKAIWDAAMAGGTDNTALDVFRSVYPETMPAYANRVWGAPMPAKYPYSNPWWLFIMMGAYASVESRKTVSTIASAAYGQICVYLHDTPDAIWDGRGTQTVTTGAQRSTWTRNVLRVVRSDIERCDWDYGWGPQYWETDTYQRVNGVQNAQITPGYAESGTANSTTSGATSEGDWAMSLRVGGRDIDAGDAGDWQALDANGLLPPYQVAVGALVSARGSAAWRATPGGAWDSNTGLPAQLLSIAQTFAGG